MQDEGCSPTVGAVENALSTVEDPDLGVDLLDASIVDDVRVDGGTVVVGVDTLGMAPSDREEVVEAMRTAVFEVPGVEAVRVEDGRSESVDFGHSSGSGPEPAACGEPGASEESGDEEDTPLPDTVVAVASAKGGVGKTTVATNLARAMASAGHTVGLFDADLYGPNLPTVVDAEGPVEADDDGRAIPQEVGDLRAMSIGFLANDAPIAWRGAMAHEAVLELLTETAWDDCEALVVDLPPGTGDVVLTTLQEVHVDVAVLVTTPYPTSLEDTQRSVTLFEENGIHVAGAVVNMAGFTCPDCGSSHALFDAGEPAERLGVPVLAELAFDPAIRDVSTPAEPLQSVAESLLECTDGNGLPPFPENPMDLRGIPDRPRHERARTELATLDPGDVFHAVTDSDPRPLLSSLFAEDERAVPNHRIDRRGPAEWKLSVRKPANTE
jgi:ATP-binding protein involved in chromosome partitioning